MRALKHLILYAAAALLVAACSASSSIIADGPLQGPGDISAAAKDVPALATSDGAQEGVKKVAASLSAAADPANKAYKVGPLDVLDITVFKVPELSKTVQVSEAGTMNFPLIGEFRAAGKTAREIEQEMAKALGGKYLQNPQITVFVKEHNSQRVTVEGAVKKPGVYPIAGNLSLLQVVALSGGLEDTSDHTAVLFRQVNGKRMAGRYDISRIRDGADADPQLEAGDVIIAPTSNFKEGLNVVLRLVPLATLAPLL